MKPYHVSLAVLMICIEFEYLSARLHLLCRLIRSSRRRHCCRIEFPLAQHFLSFSSHLSLLLFTRSRFCAAAKHRCKYIRYSFRFQADNQVDNPRTCLARSPRLDACQFGAQSFLFASAFPRRILHFPRGWVFLLRCYLFRCSRAMRAFAALAARELAIDRNDAET